MDVLTVKSYIVDKHTSLNPSLQFIFLSIKDLVLVVILVGVVINGVKF